MPTTRYLRRSHRARLNATMEMELWLGPGSNGSAFRSDEERKAMWFRRRDRLMQRWGRSGRRPMGWWLYESPFRSHRHPGTEHERSILYEFTDALSEDERAKLEQWWREQFERSWRPNFSFYAGGKIYSDDDARWQHWLFVDLPPPLLDKFLAERQRRGQVICELLQDESGERAGSRYAKAVCVVARASAPP